MNLIAHIISWNICFNKAKQRTIFLFLISLSFLNNSYGQKTLFYQIGNHKIKKQEFTDTTQIVNYLQHKLKQKFKKGFLNAYVDTVNSNNSEIYLKYHLEEKFYWNKISVQNNELISSRILQKLKKLKNKPVDYLYLEKIKKLTIQQLENNGYPFASIQTDSINIQQHKIDLEFNIVPNELIRFDSLTYNTDIRISKLLDFVTFDIQFYVQINNVFNSKVLSTTGFSRVNFDYDNYSLI